MYSVLSSHKTGRVSLDPIEAWLPRPLICARVAPESLGLRASRTFPAAEEPAERARQAAQVGRSARGTAAQPACTRCAGSFGVQRALFQRVKSPFSISRHEYVSSNFNSNCTYQSYG